jgi:hypothetical protein
MGGTTVYGSRAITVDTGGVLNIVLASAGGDDFTVDTTKLVVSGDTGYVGLGTAAPISLLDVRGPTGTGATPAGLLTLATNELTVVDGDQLGRIEFRSPIATAGTDAIVSAAAIWAEANATFSASVNSADIVFATATSGAAAERMRILSSGYVGIGITPTHKLHVSGDIKLQSSQVHLTDGYGLLWGDNGINGNASTDSLRLDTAGGARLTINSAGLVTVGNSLTVTENFLVSGAGPHAMGGAVNAANRLTLKGAFTGSGSTVSSALDLQGNLTGYAGCTSYLTKMQIQGQIITQTATESIGYISSLSIQEPNINDNLTGDITVAASLYVAGAPTEGETNAAIYVAAGASYFGGPVVVAGASDNSGILRVESTTAHAINTGGAIAFVGRNTASSTNKGTWGVIRGYDESSTSGNGNGYMAFDVSVDGVGLTERMRIASSGAVSIGGALSKGSGSFNIDHPLPSKKDTHKLVHSFIEGPKADLIYRGTVTLSDGAATVDLDVAAGMTVGTWVLLCRDEQVFTSNETGWYPVRGAVDGSTLTVECEEATCTDTVSWMVVAERQDQHMYDTEWTDENGRPIIEPLKPEVPETDSPYTSASPSA